MKVAYDSIADALYIYLSSKKKSSRTKELGEGILVDFSGKRLVGIEILDVSKKLSKKELGQITPKLPAFRGRLYQSAPKSL